MDTHTEKDNLSFNMETDGNIKTIQEERPKAKGRPKKEKQEHNNNNLNNISNKELLNLQDKLNKLRKAEHEYKKAVECLRK